MCKHLPFAILVAAAVLITTASAQETSYKLTSLDWLAGCWESKEAASQTVLSEQWMRSDGGLMIGMGRTVTKGKAVDWEQMRIEQRGSDIYFIARPRGNAGETPFKAIRFTAAEAVFENKEHDFPQRVIYRQNAAGALAARIEGVENGKAAGVDFSMSRTTCP